MPLTLYYLQDSAGQVWQLGAGNDGSYEFLEVTGVTAPASILFQDTITATIYALTLLSVPGGVEPVLTVAGGSGATSLLVQAPNGAFFGISIVSGQLSTVSFTGPSGAKAIAGVGSKLSYSLDNGVTYTEVALLRKVKPDNSKQTILDQTNILTAGNGDAPLPVRFSSGEIQIDGVLSPLTSLDGLPLPSQQNISQLTLGQLHANLQIVNWKLLLADGVTTWTWQASVSEYKPFDVDVMKAVIFSAKLRVWGALTGPLGAA
jgi:hypothetical protein